MYFELRKAMAIYIRFSPCFYIEDDLCQLKISGLPGAANYCILFVVEYSWKCLKNSNRMISPFFISICRISSYVKCCVKSWIVTLCINVSNVYKCLIVIPINSNEYFMVISFKMHNKWMRIHTFPGFTKQCKGINRRLMILKRSTWNLFL